MNCKTIYWKKTWQYAGTLVNSLITRISLVNAVKILI
jgi:hypothetical protein